MITSAKELVKSQVPLRILNWLSPSNQLTEVSGREFGRNIEASLKAIEASHKPYLLRLRKRPAAVVIATKEYDQLLELKAKYMALLETVKESQLTELSSEFDQLFARISSPQSRQAALSLFGATSEDLASTFQPGRTETL